MKMLFTPKWEAVRQSVLDELLHGQREVGYFANTLAQEPSNRLCSKAYKTALLELEVEGKVIVLDKDGHTPAPNRRKILGKMTLADGYYVKIP